MTDFQELKGAPPKRRMRKSSQRPGGRVARRRMEENVKLLTEIRALDAKHQCQNLMSRAERLDFEAALDDMRLEEAALLIRETVSLATSSSDFESFVEDGEFAEDAPRKGDVVGALWRFPKAHVEGARASLHVVGNPEAERSAFVRPHATLKSSRDQRLSAESGSFVACPDRPVRLSTVHAHDLVLVVVSGTVRVGREGTTEDHVVGAGPAVLGVCHVSSGAAFNAPLVIRAEGGHAATGIWAIACDPKMEQSDERKLTPPLSYRTSTLPWGVDSAEHSSKLPSANNERYAHKSAVREGFFARHDLNWSGDRNECVVRGCETAVRIISTPSRIASRKMRCTEIDLTIHDGLELILPVSGGFWLWTSSKGRDTPQDGDNTAGVTLSIFSENRDEKQTYALDLITAGSSQRFAADVLLLDSSVNHTIAALDSIASTCLHVSFMPLALARQTREPASGETDERTTPKVTSLSNARRARR